MNEFIDEDLYEYLLKHSSEEPKHLKKLNKETHLKILNPRMLSGHLQGRFLSLIAKIYKPKRVLEIGTYTGYSALCFSEGIEVDGEIHTIDKNKELLKIQSDYFKNCKATIKQYCGDALEIIPTINETFDLIFLDADKESIESTGRNIIEIDLKQMESFAGNLLQLGEQGNKVIVISQLAFSSLTTNQKQILSSESKILNIPIPIIQKCGGGSVRCMIAELI